MESLMSLLRRKGNYKKALTEMVFSGSLSVRKPNLVSEIKCFILKIPLPTQPQNSSSVRYRKEDGWKTRNFFHHCIEYQKDDGFCEYITIYDESGINHRIYRASIVTFDLLCDEPYAIVSVRGTVSLEEIQADNQGIDLIYDKYQDHLYTA